jgi:hypothetical protein
VQFDSLALFAVFKGTDLSDSELEASACLSICFL